MPAFKISGKGSVKQTAFEPAKPPILGFFYRSSMKPQRYNHGLQRITGRFHHFSASLAFEETTSRP